MISLSSLIFLSTRLIFTNHNDEWEKFYNESFDYFYNGEYEKAIEYLEKARKSNSDNPAIYWRLTFILWVKTEQDKEIGKDINGLEETFYQAFNKGIAICDPKSTDSEILFYLGGLYANRALFKKAIGQKNKPMLEDIKKAREYLKKIKNTDNFYYEAGGCLGIFNYGPVLMSGIQKFLVKRFGYQWDESKGLQQLKNAMKYSRYSDDIKFLYKEILMELIEERGCLERIQEAIDLVRDLAERYPRNPFLKKDLEKLKEFKNKK